MFPIRDSILAGALTFALVACAGGNNQQLTELRAELRVEQTLLKETRLEMQTLIGKLEPMLVLAEFFSANKDLLALAGSSDSSSDPHAGETATESGAAKIADQEARIKRSLVDAMLADPMVLSAGARVVPSIKNGHPNGFKVYAIRPASIHAKIGLMNGDTVHSINGLELTTPEATMAAYTKLKGASKMTFALTRRGQQITLTVHID
jgi:hypothetical protein